MTVCRILAVYDEPTRAARAITEVREKKLGEVSAYAPIPHDGLDESLFADRSPVRFYTLIGGILGGVSGFALTIYTSLAWPLITSGKPIVSIPPFMIIAFEMTILFAVFGTVLGFMISAGLPRFRPGPLYDERFSQDRYGVLVTGAVDQSAAIRAVLEGFNVVEIRSENA